MMTQQPQPPTRARLTKAFLARVAATGLTDAAVAAAIGITAQQYSAIKVGREQPTTRLLVGAVRAGLADDFAAVAEAVPAEDPKAAAA